MQLLNTFSLLFWVNTSQVQNNKVSIYARITVNGKCINFSLNRKVFLSDWDSGKDRAKGNKQESVLLNRYLDLVKTKIYEANDQLVKEKKLITASAIKARYLGMDEQNKTLLDLVSYHNRTMKTVLKPGTLKNYQTTEAYLKKFIKKQYKTDDVFLKQLSYRFTIDFILFQILTITV